MLKDHYNPRLCNLLLLLHNIPRFFNIGVKLYPLLLETEKLFTRDTSWQELGLTESEMQALCRLDWEVIAEDLAWVKEDGHHLVTIYDDDYPELLKEIPNPPLLLFVIGDLALLQAWQLAMVGSRKPTPLGYETAYMFAGAMAKTGLVISSGLAGGIDTASHIGAIEAAGKTIAVMGTGLGYIYPTFNKDLAKRIVATDGALISEFPLNSRAQAWHFPLRNRIISGLSFGTLVVEATLRSGSLITARLAGEQGREIFAIPGSIHNVAARGCHQLIQQGAKLVMQPADILEEFPDYVRVDDKQITKDVFGQIKNRLDPTHKKLINCIGFDVVTVDTLLVRTAWPIQRVEVVLLELELEGIIQRVAGGYTLCVK